MKSIFFLWIVLLVSGSQAQKPGAPTCTEGCPSGFERVTGLKHCYKLMLDLGPVSHDKAVAACGYEGGATVVTFDKPGDEQTLRNHMFTEYGTQIKNDKAYLDASGFWTGYVRFYGKFSNPFMNMYSGAWVNKKLFTPKQPNNLLLGEFGQENCLARKKFPNASVHKRKNWTGLDDYTCGFPHWAICMHRDVFGLNQQAYNTALMNNTQRLPASGECRLDWDNQNHFQLHMMRNRRIEYNQDYTLAAKYMEILDNDFIRSPTCSAE